MLQHCSLKKKMKLEETEKVTHAARFTECYFNTNVEILLCAQTLFFRVDKKKNSKNSVSISLVMTSMLIACR